MGSGRRMLSLQHHTARAGFKPGEGQSTRGKKAAGRGLHLEALQSHAAASEVRCHSGHSRCPAG